MLPTLLIVALGAASTVSALVPRGVCNANNCLRALRATSPTTRLAQAQKDCSAWLAVTTTPVETATAYETAITLTETLLEEATAVNTVHDVFTSTVLETPTSTIYTSTATVTVPPVQVVTKRGLAALPTYATACSGVAAYSSACSCIGVSTAPSTVTAPASTTTVTLPATALATIQVTTVVATSLTTVYDSTVTTTVTQPAAIVEAVTTVTETSLPEPTPIPQKFSVQVPGRAPGYLGKYDSSVISYAMYTEDPNAALALTLKPDGTLWYGDKVAKGDVNGGILALFFVTPDVAAVVRRPFICSISTDQVLTCEVPGAGADKFGIQSQANISPLLIYSGKEASLVAASRPLAVIKAI